jgi:hypothetical protein
MKWGKAFRGGIALSRIFISHSSANNAEAIALHDWLVGNGWNELFLDLHPERGLKAGERWQEELKRAANRCELVVFLISPAWAKSKWCLAEFLLAKSLNKRIFAAIVEPTSFETMPIEMTAEWQIVDLTAGIRDYRVTVPLPPGGSSANISFASDGLDRLRIGLKQAGVDPKHFEWPPSTIGVDRPTVVSDRSKPRTPAFSSGARHRSSRPSTAFEVSPKLRRRASW